MKKKDFINILGLGFSLVGAVLLFFGSQSVPWEIQTFGGVSPEEVAFKIKRFIDTNLGFGFLAVGFLLQIISHFYKK